MRQYQVRTKSYSWDYDIKDMPGTRCKTVGVISRQGLIDRAKAIKEGEYAPKGEPKCWMSPEQAGE